MSHSRSYSSTSSGSSYEPSSSSISYEPCFWNHSFPEILESSSFGLFPRISSRNPLFHSRKLSAVTGVQVLNLGLSKTSLIQGYLQSAYYSLPSISAVSQERTDSMTSQVTCWWLEFLRIRSTMASILEIKDCVYLECDTISQKGLATSGQFFGNQVIRLTRQSSRSSSSSVQGQQSRLTLHGLLDSSRRSQLQMLLKTSSYYSCFLRQTSINSINHRAFARDLLFLGRSGPSNSTPLKANHIARTINKNLGLNMKLSPEAVYPSYLSIIIKSNYEQPIGVTILLEPPSNSQHVPARLNAPLDLQAVLLRRLCALFLLDFAPAEPYVVVVLFDSNQHVLLKEALRRTTSRLLENALALLDASLPAALVCRPVLPLHLSFSVPQVLAKLALVLVA